MSTSRSANPDKLLANGISIKRAGGRGAGSSSLALVKAASSRRTPKAGFQEMSHDYKREHESAGETPALP
jgi:hypothetical protein